MEVELGLIPDFLPSWHAHILYEYKSKCAHIYETELY